MFPQANDLWKHFCAISEKESADSENTTCLHCGVSVKADPSSMKMHISNCIEFQNLAQKENSIKNTSKQILHGDLDYLLNDEEQIILNMGVVGVDSSDEYLQMHIGSAESLQKFRLVSGCFTSVNSQRAYYASRYSIPPSRSYSDFSTFCEKESQKQLHMVVLTSPLHTHFAMAIEAMEHGFHILCESPLCMTENEAMTLCKAAQVRGCVFHIINPLCYHPMIIAMHDIVKGGILGEITHIHITYSQNNRMNDMEGMDPMEVGVSDCTARLGIPAYEVLRFVYPKPVYRLMACLASASSTDLFDDNAFITLELEGGVMVSMVCSKMSALHDNEMHIQMEGTLASIEWNSLQAEKLRVCFADGSESVVHSFCREFRGIPLHLPKHTSVVCTMYEDFYNHVCSVLSGRTYSPHCITIKEAMESIFFLSMCVTSNLHFNSWVELRIPALD